jgi:hypothetical protein
VILCGRKTKRIYGKFSRSGFSNCLFEGTKYVEGENKNKKKDGEDIRNERK